MFLYTLVCSHIFVFILERIHAGLSCGKSGAYVHSLLHWFDKERMSYPLRISDEAHEHENGEREAFARSTMPQKYEQHAQLNEERRRHHPDAVSVIESSKDAGTYSTDLPVLVTPRRLLLCKACFARHVTWQRALERLIKRIDDLGVDSSLVHDPPPGACLHIGEPYLSRPSNSKGEKICFCDRPMTVLTRHARDHFKLEET